MSRLAEGRCSAIPAAKADALALANFDYGEKMAALRCA
jgi:hypothetical protein